MKPSTPGRHPGPFRVMRVDSEFAGLLVAVGFLVMGAVGLDIGKGLYSEPWPWASPLR